MTQWDELKLPSFEKEPGSGREKSPFIKFVLFALFLILVLVSIHFMFGSVAFESMSKAEIVSKLPSEALRKKEAYVSHWSSSLRGVDSELWAPNPLETQLLLNEVKIALVRRPVSEFYIANVTAILGFSRTFKVDVKEQLHQVFQYAKDNTSSEVVENIVISMSQLGVLFEFPEIMSFAKLNASERLRASYAHVLKFTEPVDISEFAKALKDLNYLLEDSSVRVQRQAIMALGSLGQKESWPGLDLILSRAEKSRAEKMSDSSLILSADRFKLYLQCFQAIVKAQNPTLLLRLKNLAQVHPNLKLRLAAQEIVKSY